VTLLVKAGGGFQGLLPGVTAALVGGGVRAWPFLVTVTLNDASG